MFENEQEIQSIKEELLKKFHRLKVLSEIKSGKEATVFLAKLDFEIVAMKLYRENTNLRSKNEYLQNKFYKTKSHFRAASTKSKFGKDFIMNNWIKREFTILTKLYEQNASVPKPILHQENAIFMEFVGTLEKPAPRLQDIILSLEQAKFAFSEIIRNIKIFLEMGIIHGDLSSFNILWFNDKIWIIDFPQALDIRQDEGKQEFLIRDLQNVCNYFSKYFEINFDKLISQFEILQAKDKEIDTSLEF